MEGFLGTRAWLRSDLALLASIGLGLLAVLSWALARRRRFPSHCRLVAVAALLNWLPVLLVMIRPWTAFVSGGAANARLLVPAVHGVVGLLAQTLMTYTVVRMQWLKRLPPRRPRWLMRGALVLWLLTVVGGSGVYWLLYVA